MSAIPSFAFPDLDASHLVDRMDVASSPFQPTDDLDVDLDSFRDPSVLEDEMIDYQADVADQNDGLMQELPDDEMVDQASTAGHDFDYNMDSFVEQPRDEDEDILYEDDEEPEEIPRQSNNDDAEPQPDVDQNTPIIAEGANDQNTSNGLGDTTTLQDDDNSAIQDNDHTKPQGSSNAIDSLDPTQDSTDSNLPQFDAQQDAQQDAQSSSDHPEQPPQTLEQQQEDEEEEDLLPEDSENVHTDSLDPQQEDNSTVEVAQNDPLVPQETSRASPDAQPENVQDSNEIQTQQARDVHPVTLVYLEEEMSLFPPMLGDDSTVYFLSDSSLAIESLDKLLAACRELLTGTLDHDDELVLDVPGLGLHICEDSKYSAQISLADVLEVYLNLCHNDVDDQSQPLYCHLSSRVSLASQYAYLSSAGTEGKTYAEVAADHIDTPLEDSTHVDDQVYAPEAQEANANATEHQGQHNAEELSRELTPAPDVEGQVQPSENTFNPQHAIEEPIEELDGHSQAQEAGVPMLNEDILVEAVDTPSQNGDPDERQEQLADFGTSGTADQEVDRDQSNHEQVHETETNSSHTVEAYRDDIEDQEPYEEVEGEDLFSTVNQDVEDLSNQQENADYEENYSDEELFAQDDLGQEVNGPSTALNPEETNDQSLSETIDQKPFEDDVPTTDLDYLDDEAESGLSIKPEGKVSIVPSPPITPSKAKLAKRKAEADEELDFLDISTPEPKRRRPS
jgi:hypothetical protein